MSAQPHFSELTDAEASWIEGLLDGARKLGADPANAESIGALFDAALRDVSTGGQSPEIANTVVNIVAAALGEHLRHRCGVQWRIVSDEMGTDLCLHDPASNWTLFPQSSVAKRWDGGEEGWVVPFCAWAEEMAGAKPGH